LVHQYHLLERETFIAIWVAIFGVLSLYLLGKIKLPHDSPTGHISVGRLLIGLLVLSFTIYLIPGMWGAPIKLVSGFTPPLFYAESPDGVGYRITGDRGELPEGAHFTVHDIVAFDEYEEGLAYAKKVNKPVLLDFTGWACVNCRKMEEHVWSDPSILPIIRDEYVLISLYTDDHTKLPKEEQYESDVINGKVRTVGDKWYEFQKAKFNAVSQPYYIKLDTEGEPIDKGVGYTRDIDTYKNWLMKK
jgi:hypothetical protein